MNFIIPTSQPNVVDLGYFKLECQLGYVQTVLSNK